MAVILSYLKYLVSSRRILKQKTPILQALNAGVFTKINSVQDQQILNLIQSLKKDDTIISITDLGAGSRQSKSNKRTVKSIVKNAAIPSKFGRLLNQLIRHYQYHTVVELGTSLGVGTAYLSLNNPNTSVYTIEGCPNISKRAQANLNQLKFNNIHFFQGEFSSQFNNILAEVDAIDLIYIDGNHTYDATLAYYHFFKSKMTQQGLMVFDDIHWSRGMEQAWSEIIKDDTSTLTIDLFRMGLIFVNPDFKTEHLVLRF